MDVGPGISAVDKFQHFVLSQVTSKNIIRGKDIKKENAIIYVIM